MITRLSAASSIASSSLRLSPCASEPARRGDRPPSPTRSSAHAARSSASRTPAARRQIRSAPPMLASAARRTFSSTLRNGKTLEIWNVRPSPRCVRRYGGTARDRPRRRAGCGPPSAGSRPERRLKSVVLPAPFGPMMPSSSPCRTSSPTSATMVAPPMSSPRPEVSRMCAVKLALLEGRHRRLQVARRARLHELRPVVRALPRRAARCRRAGSSRGRPAGSAARPSG